MRRDTSGLTGYTQRRYQPYTRQQLAQGWVFVALTIVTGIVVVVATLVR